MDQREDINGLATGVSTALFVVHDQDELHISQHYVNVSGVFPGDGDPALLRGLRSSDIFILEPLGDPVLDESSHAWVSNWTIAVQTGILLSSFSATEFTIMIDVGTAFMPNVSHAADDSTHLIVPIRVVRSNWPVSWPSSTVTATVPENSPPGTIVFSLLPLDSDPTQSFLFDILSSNASLGMGLFALNTTSHSYFIEIDDPSLNRSSSVASRRFITRGADVVVALDALDADSGDTAVALQIRVTDDGFFNNSRLPYSASTSSDFLLTIQISNLNDWPMIATVAHVPEAGLSVTGGDVLEVTGAWLGLPAGTASIVTASLVTVDGSARVWPFASCVVAERLVRLRCVSPSGYGAALNVSVTVSQRTVVSYVPGLAFQRPQLNAVYASTSAGSPVPDRVLPPSGRDVNGSNAFVTFRGVGFPPNASASLYNVSLVQGARVFPVIDPATSCTFTGDRVMRAGALTCAAPGVAGGRGVQGVVVAVGVSSDAPDIAYARPSVTNVTVDPANDLSIIISGDNLGPTPESVMTNVSSGEVSPWTADFFAGVVALDWVRYMAVPAGVDPNRIDSVGSPISGEHYPSDWCLQVSLRLCVL